MQHTTLALLMTITATTTACGDDGGGTGVDGGGQGSGSDMAAWSDGPQGHVYTWSGPIYDLDAHDGHVLRELPIGMHHGASQLRATADTAYYTGFDDGGTGRIWKLAPGATTDVKVADQSVSLFGVVGNELIGELNEEAVTRTNLATGAITKLPFPGAIGNSLTCGKGSLYQHTLYLACSQFAGGGINDAMVTYDLDANAYGPVVVVGARDSQHVYDPDVTGTASGALFTRLEATSASEGVGTRSVYKITGTTVSAPVVLPGSTASNLDQQAAIGSKLFVTQPFGTAVLPFDAATMTAGAPIEMDHPRAIRAGGGQLWIATHQSQGQLAKLDPATGAVEYKTFPRVESHEIEWLAFGDDQ